MYKPTSFISSHFVKQTIKRLSFLQKHVILYTLTSGSANLEQDIFTKNTNKNDLFNLNSISQLAHISESRYPYLCILLNCSKLAYVLSQTPTYMDSSSGLRDTPVISPKKSNSCLRPKSSLVLYTCTKSAGSAITRNCPSAEKRIDLIAPMLPLRMAAGDASFLTSHTLHVLS